MKASIYKEYGSSSVLKIEEVEKPVPKGNEVLVKIYAATVNRTDCAMLGAKPFLMRFSTGLFNPKNPILGTDFAGIIEELGKDVTRFKVGDKVFGFDDTGLYSHAQFTTIADDNAIEIIPDNTTYEQAAASIEGAHYAYNFINKVKIKKGAKILVNGATGAIGSAATQLLKYYGADITATCATKNIELVKSLGANKIIDYTKEDFTKTDEKYDFVFDTVGKSSFGKCKRILVPEGIYISSELGYMAQNIFFALFTPIFSKKKVIFPIPVKRNESVELIKKLCNEGHFKSVIDRKYPLNEIADAFSYVEKGQKTGNVVITMKHDS